MSHIEAGADGEQVLLRASVHLGDVEYRGKEVYGDGVNTAARLLPHSPEGGMALSAPVLSMVRQRLQLPVRSIGAPKLKNIESPVEIFVVEPGAQAPDRGRTAATEPAPRVGICVLPFANISGDPEQEYFSDGITEDIITDLSKVSALAVVSRNTSFTFKSQSVNVREVARHLGVSHVLEGSVRKAGNRVRITAQLIRAADDSHLWAERYDRDLADIFALQDEISRAIVAALKVRLLPSEQEAIEARSTTNTEAYKIYLLARRFHATANSRHFPVIIRLCRRAVEIDPGYARAWALLALAQMLTTFYTNRKEDAVEAIRRALQLNPDLAEAHAATVWLRMNLNDGVGARAAAERALALDPESFDVQAAAGRCYFWLQRWDEAIAHFQRAAAIVETDFWSLTLATAAYRAKADASGHKACAARALARIEAAVAAEPDNAAAMAYGAGCLEALGEHERALEWAERAVLMDPDDNRVCYNAACVMAALGEVERSLGLIESAIADAGPMALHWARMDPELDPIRGDPRFGAMLERVKARLAAEPASHPESGSSGRAAAGE